MVHDKFCVLKMWTKHHYFAILQSNGGEKGAIAFFSAE